MHDPESVHDRQRERYVVELRHSFDGDTQRFLQQFFNRLLRAVANIQGAIMASADETKVALQTLKTMLQKVQSEQQAQSAAETALIAKVAELQALVDAGGAGVPQEVTDLITEATSLAQAMDDARPDPIVLPPDPPVDPVPA